MKKIITNMLSDAPFKRIVEVPKFTEMLNYMTKDVGVQMRMDQQDLFNEKIDKEKEREFNRGVEMSAEELKKEKAERLKAEQEKAKAEQEAKNSKIEMAKMMIKYGESIKEIMTKTGLSESEIFTLNS